MARDAVSELIYLAAQKPIRESSPVNMFAPAPARRTHDDTHQVTHRVVKHRDLTKPLVAAGIAIASVAAFAVTVHFTRRAPATQAAALAVAPAPTAAAVPVPAAVAVPAPVPAAVPAAAAAPPAAPVAAAAAAPAPAAQPALVDLWLESSPAGATVTIVDRGVSTLAGTTPLSLAVDPSRQYDLVYTLEGRDTKIVHVDPQTTTKLALELPAPTEPHAAPAPAPHHHHDHAQARVAAVAAAPPKGNGTLMISSKPPCEIAIDGQPTGLVTPQRAMTLPAGPHQVTLSNSQQHVRKTFGFAISSNHATKLIRDLMK